MIRWILARDAATQGVIAAALAILCIIAAQWLDRHDLRDLLPTKGTTVEIPPAK